MRFKTSRPLVLAVLTGALLGACYDMPLIPDDAPAIGGSAGHGNAGLGNAGRASAGAGSGGTHSSGGAPNTSGGSKPIGSGGANAGSGGKSPASGGTNGHAGSSGAPSITWLDLTGSKAPSSSTINAALGIEGSFYAYGDDCATAKLTWDAANRCVSGTLCPSDFNTWGISIGFDFHNTGAAGMPPDAKLTWNPESHGARGIAWQVSGKAPNLDVWVLNMDASWNGECTGTPCEIDGAPDGIASAPLNGQLHFDNMQKDTWGAGIMYEFDPAAVHALQFKIPVVKAGAASFNFCIAALGIIH